MASAANESAIAKRLRNSTRPKAAAASTAATTSASHGSISPRGERPVARALHVRVEVAVGDSR